MRVGCGLRVRRIDGNEYLYFWHYEREGGRSERREDYVGPVREAKSRQEAARKLLAFHRRGQQDLGRSLSDGQRIFGDGKTWRGLVGGTLAGAILGLLLSLPFDLLAPSSSWSFGPPAVAFVASAVLSLGALLGDLVGAFVKRRMHLPRGAKASGLDQYDFGVGSLLLSLATPAWPCPPSFTGDALLGLLAIIVITPALHRAVNLVGYRMGKKHEPW